jgi:ribosomal protein L37AE/L43A
MTHRYRIEGPRISKREALVILRDLREATDKQEHRCPKCGHPTIPPAVEPRLIRHCAHCGWRFRPGNTVTVNR